MARNYLCVPFEFFVHDAAELTDEEFGRLVRGMFLYFTESKEIIPQGNEKFFTKSAMAAQDNFKKKYEETSQKRREAGQKGASKRWQAIANDSKCHQMMANDSTIVLDLDIESSNKVLDIDKKENKKEKESSFDRFWSAYPRKVGKGEARKAFAKIKGVPVDTMIQAVEKQKQSTQWQRDGGQYIPHPATWLNQERWEDEVTTANTVKNYDDGGDLDWLVEQMGLSGQVNSPETA